MSEMEELAEFARRMVKALEAFTPEQVQKTLDQAYAQIQVMQYLEAEAEKRKLRLTQAKALGKMNNLRKTWTKFHATRPVLGVLRSSIWDGAPFDQIHLHTATTIID